MSIQTINQVDPIALRKKLRRLGIGAKFQFSQAAAEDAARDFGNHAAKSVEIVANDIEVSGAVIADVDCECPKCGHEWTMDSVEMEDDAIPVDGSDIVDAVEVVSETGGISPGSCVLEPAEIAYMLHAWAMLWEVPE